MTPKAVRLTDIIRESIMSKPPSRPCVIPVAKRPRFEEPPPGAESPPGACA